MFFHFEALKVIETPCTTVNNWRAIYEMWVIVSLLYVISKLYAFSEYENSTLYVFSDTFSYKTNFSVTKKNRNFRNSTAEWKKLHDSACAMQHNRRKYLPLIIDASARARY